MAGDDKMVELNVANAHNIVSNIDISVHASPVSARHVYQVAIVCMQTCEIDGDMLVGVGRW